VGHTGGGTARRRRRGERSDKTVAVRLGGSLVWQEKASSLGSLVGCGSGADGERQQWRGDLLQQRTRGRKRSCVVEFGGRGRLGEESRHRRASAPADEGQNPTLGGG
jgi:hypothetical protein